MEKEIVDLKKTARILIDLQKGTLGVPGGDWAAREAFQYGYNQYFIENAMAAHAEEEHPVSLKHVFPYIGKVRLMNNFIKRVGE